MRDVILDHERTPPIGCLGFLVLLASCVSFSLALTLAILSAVG